MLKVFYFVSFAACVALFYSSKWRHHCVVALGICFLFIFAMNQASRSLRADLMSSLFKENPNINLKDIFLSSSPGNLLCWRTTIAEARQEHIVYHSGRIAIWPKIKTLAQCEVSTSEPPSPANYTFLPNERWRFKQSIYYPKAEFAELQRKNCYFENFLYFARLPAWQIQNERLQFGDLRFQRKRPASGFTNFDYPLQSQNCPFSAVPWRPPSHDWL